ncbi:TerB family tellurite resistance protein [Alteromonas sp. 5E99-2]|uniref:tellurite resistance TerB family protein n=1 Tax=Alteromonas sp. 5E99-2 TaxID=2817683 RepID=UPI001A99C2AE|nr:TerB family tellurite resistance protein [Alteromonas sp. 5E99-2]MBO1256131.1 TerB family tellurite resistance protein [Alteromonas sp. 5E99-2]
MLKTFLTLFENSQASETNEHTVELATAALLSEVVRADNQIDAQELQAVKKQITTHFSLSKEELSTLLNDGQKQSEHAVDLIQFTSVINDTFELEQRVKILESLWQVALADGNIDKYEEYIIRKISDLLYIPHSRYIQAKLAVIED